jgi:hypothetical protein
MLGGSSSDPPPRIARSRLCGSYETGTVMVSEMVLPSNRVKVASPNSTSVTVAVHIGFGHDPGGAVGDVVD